MNTIVTHIFPDLDAITSSWLLVRFMPGFEDATIAFTPQQKDWNGIKPDADPTVVYVDTGFGKFDHHQVHERISATRRVFDYLMQEDVVPKRIAAALERIVTFVTDIDNFGEVHFPDPSNDRYDFCLQQIISGMKRTGKTDDQLVMAVFPLLDGMVELFATKIKAEKEIQKGFVFTNRFGKCIAMNTPNDEAMRLAQKMGYVLVITRDPQKGTARIKTIPSEQYDLTPVYEKIKEKDTKGYWYLHIHKNMLLNGSSRTPDVVPTPLSLQQLIEIIQNI
jgi:hypothetical protein